MSNTGLRLTLLCMSLVVLTACSTRQVQDSLAGATAQQLMTHSIDDLAQSLPEEDFSRHTGKRVHLTSHFVEYTGLQSYADQRLAVELARRFDMQVVDNPLVAEVRLQVFYTALGTDHSRKGLVLPLGFVPGVDESIQIDLIALDQFHGVAEMYYFLGPSGHEHRSDVLQARTRTDAIGLPIITIPISNIDRADEGGD